MTNDHIKGFPGWFSIRPAEVGHHCEYNVFRVTVIPNTHCECGTLIPDKMYKEENE